MDNRYGRFLSSCLTMMTRQKALFAGFTGLSVLTALSEGVGISMLVPILDSMGGEGAFADVPLLGYVSTLFESMEPRERLTTAAMVLILVILVRSLLQYLTQYLAYVLYLLLRRELSKRAYDAFIGSSMGFIHRSRAGDINNHLHAFPNRIGGVLTSFSQLVSSLLLTIIFVTILFSISITLTLIVVVILGGLSITLKSLSAKHLKKLGQAVSGAAQQVHQTIYETLNGMRLIRQGNAEPRMRRSFHDAVDGEYHARRRQGLVSTAITPFFNGAVGILICLMLLAGVWLGQTETSEVVATTMMFMFILYRLMGPVTVISQSRATIDTEIHAMDDMQGFLERTKKAREPNGDKSITTLEREIVFDEVNFTYPGEEGPAVRDVSFTITKGEMVAIVGPSGAGKSTLAALLTRLYDPHEGNILIDGIDLRALDVTGWRRLVSVVSQDIVIFNDTALNNIRFIREDATLEEVRDAARQAAADDFIIDLPNGYDTFLGDRGVRLSGGQQQRIALARAILADPQVLILDEATSHLDSLTEKAIQNAVERMSHKRTLMVIAHRLSTVRKADRIIVMQNGRIVEQGPHEILINQNGMYRGLLDQQCLDLVPD